jgi:serine/threonine protein kinase
MGARRASPTQSRPCARVCATQLFGPILGGKRQHNHIQDIARGVYHIHEEDFVWGDCKPENVLICQHSTDRTSVTAKLSDFGLSVAGSSGIEQIPLEKSIWMSKEAKDVVGLAALKQSEMYSLGLVIWSVLLDGRQFRKAMWTFDRTLSVDQSGEISSEHIINLTATGDLQAIACASFNFCMLSVISENDV